VYGGLIYRGLITECFKILHIFNFNDSVLKAALNLYHIDAWSSLNFCNLDHLEASNNQFKCDWVTYLDDPKL